MEKRWEIKEQPNTEVVKDLRESLNISEVLAILLAQRGITNFALAK